MLRVVFIFLILFSDKILADGPVYNFNFYNAQDPENINIENHTNSKKVDVNSKIKEFDGTSEKDKNSNDKQDGWTLNGKPMITEKSNWTYEVFVDFSMHNQRFEAGGIIDNNIYKTTITGQGTVGVAFRYFSFKLGVGFSHIDYEIVQSGYIDTYEGQLKEWRDFGSERKKLGGLKLNLEYDSLVERNSFAFYGGLAFSSFDGNLGSKLYFENIAEIQISSTSLYAGLKYRFEKVSLYASVGGANFNTTIGAKGGEMNFSEKYMEIEDDNVDYNLKLAYSF